MTDKVEMADFVVLRDIWLRTGAEVTRYRAGTKEDGPAIYSLPVTQMMNDFLEEGIVKRAKPADRDAVVEAERRKEMKRRR